MPTGSASPVPPAPADLLREAGWLRGLALRLVRDEAQADDVVQETWRRALEKPPRDRGALPAWLARTARNAAFEEHRRDGRRRAREARVARPDHAPATDDIVARTELHRRLVDALLALDEPFRSTLLLRYFDDLSTPEIAKRNGVPAATVRTRLKRGLDRLRLRLDAEHDGRRHAWVLSLVPWARDGARNAVGVGTAVMGGAIAMTTVKKTALVALLLLLVGGAGAVAPRLIGRAPDGNPSAPTTGAETSSETEAPVLVGRQAPEPPPPTPVERDAPLPPWTVAGNVRAIDGTPIANAIVLAIFHRGPVAVVMARGFSDASGLFRLDCAGLARVPDLQRASGRLELTAWADGFAPGPEDSLSYALEWRASLADFAVELVLHRGHAFVGRVVDARGGSVSKALVYAALGGRDARIVARTLPDGTWRGRIHGSGRFAIRASSVGVGNGVIADVDTVEGEDVYLPDLVLRGEGTISGVVRFPDGSPASFADVTCSAVLPQRFSDEPGLRESRAVADLSGHFVLRGLKPGRYAVRPQGFPRSEHHPAYETGETDAVLEVHHRRVLVCVEDEDGHGVPGVSITGTWIHPDGTEDMDVASLDAHSRHTFWVSVGDRLVISSSLPGANYAEAAVDADEMPWDREIVLTLRRVEEETGRIRVRLTGDDGTPITTMVVRVETQVAGRSLTGLHECSPDADGLLPPVPVGTWNVRITPGRGADQIPIEPWFPVFTRVTVRPGAVTEIDETARGGGRFRLTLRVPEEANLVPRDVQIAATSLRSRDRTTFGGWISPFAGQGWRMGALRFHEPCFCNPLLAPGEYRVSVRAPGYDAFEEKVSIGAGEIVDVTVDLEPSAQAGAPVASPPASPETEGDTPDLTQIRLGQMSWDDTPLAEIAAYLAKKFELELRMTEQAISVLPDIQITCQFDDIAVSTVLDLCTGPNFLRWKVVGRTLWIGGNDEVLPPR